LLSAAAAGSPGSNNRWAAAVGAYDNALCESFFKTLKSELVDPP